MQNKKIIKIEGMHCAACVQRVERALKKKKGVIEANVNLATEKAAVKFDEKIIDEEEIKKTIKDTGYKPKDTEDKESKLDEDIKNLKIASKRMWIAWAFTIPIIILMIPEMLFGIMLIPGIGFHIAFLILAAPVIFWTGSTTIKSAVNSVLHKSANMDVLIAMGTLAAFMTGIAGNLCDWGERIQAIVVVPVCSSCSVAARQAWRSMKTTTPAIMLTRLQARYSDAPGAVTPI